MFKMASFSMKMCQESRCRGVMMRPSKASRRRQNKYTETGKRRQTQAQTQAQTQTQTGGQIQRNKDRHTLSVGPERQGHQLEITG